MNCDHKNYKIIKIEDGKVEAYCGNCNHTLQRNLEKFTDKMNLLFHFSEDICATCEHIPNCWDSEHRVMPKPNFMKHYCKKGAHYCFGNLELDIVQRTAIMELERRKREGVGN